MVCTPSAAQIEQALQNKLGTNLSHAIAEDVSQAMRGYTPLKTPLEEMEKQVETAIFRSLYRELGVSMVYTAPDARRVRIRTDDLPTLADAALSALFSCFQPTPTTFHLLYDYALHSGSYAALSALYHRYSTYCPDDLPLISRLLEDRNEE